MNWRVKTQWFSEPPEYRYFAIEQEARDFIAENQHLWWVLERKQWKQ